MTDAEEVWELGIGQLADAELNPQLRHGPQMQEEGKVTGCSINKTRRDNSSKKTACQCQTEPANAVCAVQWMVLTADC